MWALNVSVIKVYWIILVHWLKGQKSACKLK